MHHLCATLHKIVVQKVKPVFAVDLKGLDAIWDTLYIGSDAELSMVAKTWERKVKS